MPCHAMPCHAIPCHQRGGAHLCLPCLHLPGRGWRRVGRHPLGLQAFKQHSTGGARRWLCVLQNSTIRQGAHKLALPTTSRTPSLCMWLRTAPPHGDTQSSPHPRPPSSWPLTLVEKTASCGSVAASSTEEAAAMTADLTTSGAPAPAAAAAAAAVVALGRWWACSRSEGRLLGSAGTAMEKQEPLSGAERTKTQPPMASTSARQMAS